MPRIHRLALAATLVLLSTVAVGSPLDIPNVPLNTGGGVPPNIVFVLDNSGSMGWDYMPDEADYSDFKRRSPYHNKIYFDPAQDYTPPPYAFSGRYPDSSYPNAWVDGFNQGSGKQNITSDTHVREQIGSNYYFVTWLPKPNCSDYNQQTCFTRYVYGTSCSGVSSSDVCSSDPADLVKVANWYSYYRTRILMAKSAVLRAFSNMNPAFRFGYYAINNSSLTQVSPFGDGSANTTKAKFWSWMAGMTPSGGTPLRKALSDVGEYYKEDQPWQDDAGNKLACRQSFTILTTDGYWNENYSGVGDADGTDGEVITSPDGKKYQYKPAPPFSDGAGKSYSNTLADVAMYYWKTDLRTDLDNKVPTTATDPAFWQHMSTFTISLGMDPTGLQPPGTTIDQVFKWGLYGGPAISGFYWPQPSADSENKIADLAHAGLNGRGGFYSAKDPTQFAEALNNALAAISDRTTSASNVAVNLNRITTDTLAFQARYNPGNWTGELLAYPVTATGIGDTPKWFTSIPAVGSRKIFTSNGSNGGISFDWSSLTAAQKTALGSQTDAVKQDIVNYLRGDQSKEVQNGGTLRNRKSLLGDIIHSSPVFADNQQSGTARAQTVFVGANDGMLHAFDATNGQEIFAYVPNLLIGSNLASLSDPAYTHRYFVDGPIAVSNYNLTPNKQILVASLGYGGKGLFALDVTNPKSFSATNVKWEFGNDADLGLVIGEMLLAKTNDGSTVVIFGNGYNSTNEHAVLFVLNLDTGALIRKIDTGVGSANGLSAVLGWDNDGNGTIDYVYAGDLQGNLWKFDLSDNNASKWDVALKQGNQKQALFHAQDKNGKAQPITARPSLGANPADGSLWVFFGTGRYLTTGDVSDTSTQSWYGIIDDGKNPVTRSQLKARKIVARGKDPKTGNPVRAFELATSGDMNNKKGWYVDLDPGERMITSSQFYGSVLLASSIIPSDDPCTPGGTGYVNAIDPFTGAALGTPFFTDYGTLTVEGQKIPVGSVDLGIGMPGQAQIVGDKLVVGGSSGETASTSINLPNVMPHRVNWRELIRE